MIVSHKYKYIFLKTNKTAGTSVEIALSKFCGPDDIITPISPEDTQIRNALGFPGPQNFLAPNSDYTLRDWARFFCKGNRKMRFYNHISAAEARLYIDQKTWNDYYKFCIERNPWDRIISLYYYQYQSEPRLALAEFIRSDHPAILKRLGFSLYTVNGQVVVDKICRFENIGEELEEIRKKLGIPGELNLPHAKSRFRNDRRSYREILGKEEQEKIANLFRDEISLLGYQF